MLRLEELLPSPDAGPEALYFRSLLLDEFELAVDELPPEERARHLWHMSWKAAVLSKCRRDRSKRKHSALTQTLCGDAPARAVAKYLRRIYENEEMNMRKKWILWFPGTFGDRGLHWLIGGEIVLHLWNWLLPPLFGWRSDHILASTGSPGLVPHSLRQPRMAWPRPLQFSRPHERQDAWPLATA